jgi:hypothetical protein
MKQEHPNDFFTNTIRLRMLAGGVVQYTYISDLLVDENEHRINHEALVNFIGIGKKALVLVDAENFISFSPEARKLVRKLESVVPILARAMVVRTLSERLFSNFYILTHKPIIPTKIFSNYDDAFTWLNTFKNK